MAFSDGLEASTVSASSKLAQSFGSVDFVQISPRAQIPLETDNEKSTASTEALVINE